MYSSSRDATILLFEFIMVTLFSAVFNERILVFWCLLSVFLTNHFVRTEPLTKDALLKPNTEKKCAFLLEQFVTKTANFSRCVILHTQPMMICQECADKFYDVVEAHNNISKLQENSDGACQEELFNVNRLDLIESSFQIVNKQWKKATCEKCFTSDENSCTVNSYTLKIFEMHNETETCFKNSKVHNASTLCDDCQHIYCKLNNFYVKHGSHRGFCMDVIDMMNNTRYQWRNTYYCSAIREKTEITFLASSVIICMLPIIFYFFIWLFSTFSFPEISTQNRWSRFSRLDSNPDDSR